MGWKARAVPICKVIQGVPVILCGRQLPLVECNCKQVCLLAICCAQVWDFARVQTEQVLAGHGGDVKSVDWHPTKGLLVSGAHCGRLGFQAASPLPLHMLLPALPSTSSAPCRCTSKCFHPMPRRQQGRAGQAVVSTLGAQPCHAARPQGNYHAGKELVAAGGSVWPQLCCGHQIWAVLALCTPRWCRRRSCCVASSYLQS